MIVVAILFPSLSLPLRSFVHRIVLSTQPVESNHHESRLRIDRCTFVGWYRAVWLLPRIFLRSIGDDGDSMGFLHGRERRGGGWLHVARGEFSSFSFSFYFGAELIRRVSLRLTINYVDGTGDLRRSMEISERFKKNYRHRTSCLISLFSKPTGTSREPLNFLPFPALVLIYPDDSRRISVEKRIGRSACFKQDEKGSRQRLVARCSLTFPGNMLESR